MVHQRRRGERLVPDSYIRIEGNKGRVVVDYDAIEFTVEVGETLEYIKETKG